MDITPLKEPFFEASSCFGWGLSLLKGEYHV